MQAILTSRTAIAAIITVIASLLSIAGYTFGEAEQTIVVESITSFVTLLTGVYVIVRRVLQSKSK